ncbi:hypothetical protein R1flu_002808 [Riccia fluitans]|uniref:Uncharacterized protein n=1 Tax=Riccia fluitans TaxID=41844 RepID=A0ABD1Y761_9MARC
MRRYERNYDFGDLLDCASGLNPLALLEYGKEVIKLPKAHVKQRPLWAKLHPLPPGHAKPNLSDFTRLATDDQITEALKVGLQQAQTLLTQLNISPHAGMRDKTWWRTSWTLEKELGIFGMSSSTQEPDHKHFELNYMEEVVEMPNKELSSDLWDILEAIGAPSTMEVDVDAEGDETNDLEVYGHEARHVMSETMSTLLMEHAPTNRKVNPMVSYEGHEMYKASLVNLLVGNPTLSKDRLTCIKQSVYFNGVKPKPRLDGIPVCIMDVESDCVMLFDGPNNLFSINSRGLRTRQKGRRDGQTNQVLFNWYSPIAGSRVKFTYDNIDLQWIDLEGIITIVSLKMEAIQPRRAFFQVFQLDADARSALRSPVRGEVDKGEEVKWRYRAVKFKTQVVGQFVTS